MPIYEYACQSCGHEFEAMQKISDEPISLCPSCGENKAKKLVSAPQFKLKGSGWYETDFKDKPKKPNADSKSSSGGNNKSEKKTETKEEAGTSSSKSQPKTTKEVEA